MSVSQVVDVTTRKEKTLDLFFTSNPTLTNKVIQAPPLSLTADHDIILIDINTRALIPKQKPTKRFTYSKANWEAIKNSLASYKLPLGNVQNKWDDFVTNSVIRKTHPSESLFRS